MKSITKYLGIIAMTLTIVGCGKDDSIDIVPDPVQEEPEQEEPQPEDPKQEDPVVLPTLTSVDPAKGPKATLVTIEGTLFGTDASKVKVFFNEQEATVQTVTETAITSMVPVGAGTGVVKVIVDGHELAGPDFEYELTVLVSTLAGGIPGDADGQGTAAKFDTPSHMTMDSQGNIYVSDFSNHKVKIIGPNADVATLAGSTFGFADGTGTLAKFEQPTGIVMDEVGNIFVADRNNHRIRKIHPSGEVSTIAGGEKGFADGIGTAAQFDNPNGLAIDKDANLYVADAGNHKIRKISPLGEVSTVAGSEAGFEDGTWIDAKFNGPKAIVVDQESNLYVADEKNNSIRKITPDGMVTTLTGGTEGFQDGVLAEAKFHGPTGLAIDTLGNMYVAEFGNHKIRKIATSGVVSTLAGGEEGFADGAGDTAQFDSPFGILLAPDGTLYVGDSGNFRIRKITQE